MKAPPRAKLYMWCILCNKAPTGDNLQNRTYHAPTWCILCKQALESIDHLFLTCPITIAFWHDVLTNLQLQYRWKGENILEAWKLCWSVALTPRIQNLPILICWSIWLQRNKLIFSGMLPRWPHATTHLIYIYHGIPEEGCPHIVHNIVVQIIDINYSWEYFDGYAQLHGCGGGILLHITDNHFYKIEMGIGDGTNNFVELITLFHLLYFAMRRDVIAFIFLVTPNLS